MKFFAVLLLMLLVGTAAMAQTSAVISQTANIDAQRRAIAEERAQVEARLLVEDAACYQKFAVNNCLQNVDAQRLKAMAGLRKQEIKLNDDDRKKKGNQQLRNIQEKTLPEKLAQDHDSRAQSLKDFRVRQERDKENASQRSAVATTEKSSLEANAAKLQANEKKIQARALQQASAAKETERFNARQAKANERRIEHAAEQAKRIKPAAQPLPIPQ